MKVRWSWALPLFLCAGCAKNSPQPSTAEGQATDAAQASKAAPAPLPALSAVPAPEGVIARFRVLDPKKFADGLLDAASIPFDLNKAIAEVDGEYSFVRAVDLEAPVEGALVLNPEDPMNPSRFFSVGVRSVEEVLTRLEASRIVVQEGPSGVHHFLLGADPCAVGRSLGRSPARVVCSDRRGGLHQVLPYALRGFPTEQLSEADVYARLDFRPVRDRYKTELDRLRLLASVFARQAHVGHAKLDRALTDAALGLADELSKSALEFDQFVMEVDEHRGDAQLTMRATFDGQSSLTAQSIRAQVGLSAPAPPLFRSLPSTTASGFYFRELPAGPFESWRSIFVDLFTGYAEYRGASLAFAERLGRTVQAFGPSARTHVHAQGPIVTTTVQGRSEALPAWSIWGMTQPKAEVIALLDDMAWLLASPDWIKLVEEPEFGGRLKKTPKTLKGVRGSTVYQWSFSDQAIAQLERELVVPDGMSREDVVRAAKQMSRGHLGVFEHEAATYLTWAAGDDLTALNEAVQALQGKDVQRLTEVKLVRKMLDEAAVGAGFATLLGVGSGLWSFAPSNIVKDLTGLLNATPNRAQVPLFVRYNVRADTKIEAEYSVTVPREFTQDAATLAALVFTEMDVD